MRNKTAKKEAKYEISVTIVLQGNTKADRVDELARKMSIIENFLAKAGVSYEIAPWSTNEK